MPRSSKDPKARLSTSDDEHRNEEAARTPAGNDDVVAEEESSPWVSREYHVPIRDATAPAMSINTPLTSPVGVSGSSRPNGRAAAAANANTTPRRQAWEHMSTTGGNSASMDATPPRARSAASAPAQASNAPAQPSFLDQTAASALGATLEFLRIAGGVTLSTTGKLVAPPLLVTRKIVLPSLWHAMVDYISTVTPSRAKGWFKIISSSFHHFFSVLWSTTRGTLFRARVVRVGGDILDCISSDNARQVLMDSMGCLVKAAEALHTPEFKALLDQLSIMGCRLVDAGASGRNKQLIHDFHAMIYSGCELLADPSTTLALAEVTAYLCHALEMEDAAMHQVEQDALQQAARRHERDAYQRATYVDPTLLQDPEVTVEQVILSSLGVPPATSTDDGDAGSSVPSNVVVEEMRSDVEWEQSSIRQQLQETGSHADEHDDDAVAQRDKEEFHQKARNSINLDLLREKITQRAATIERRGTAQTPPGGLSADDTNATIRDRVPTPVHFASTTQRSDQEVDLEEIGGATTVLDDEDSGKVPRRRQPLHLDSATNDGNDMKMESVDKHGIAWPQMNNALPLENETSVHHFYRVLDEVLARKRNEAVGSALTGSSDGLLINKAGRVKRKGQALTSTAAGNRSGPPESLRQRLAAIRSEFGTELSKEQRGQMERTKSMMNKHGILIRLALVAILFIVLAWIGFGCYGMYVYVYPSVQTTLQTAKSALHLGGSSATPAAQEFVVRIIREVVHVGADGAIIGRGADAKLVSEEGIDSIAKCVAGSL